MEQTLKNTIAPLVHAVKQYHATIVTVIIAVLISIAVFRLYQIVTISFETGVNGYAPTPKASSNFDQKTIERIDDLKSINDSNSALVFPNRPSPFVE